MAKNVSRILSYLIECISAENREAFNIAYNSKNLSFFQNKGKEIYEYFYSENTFVKLKSDENLVKFIKNKESHHKSDKLYLSLEHIFETKNKLKKIVPLYVVEVMFELVNDEFKLSKIDYEPTFNLSLLPSSISINEILLISDNISELQSWVDKVKIFKKYLDKNIVNQIQIKPFLFGGNIFQTAQSAVTRELDWIKNRYLGDIKNTALGYIFNDNKKKTKSSKKKLKKIEIFELNETQNTVVEYALSNPFTVITGPPGTGKSQVVLNLLANIYISNKTVLFASKNNKAVNTVIDKLEGIQEGYCGFVRLGNKHEKQKGLQKLLESVNNRKNISFKSSKKHINQLLSEIEHLYQELQTLEQKFKQYCDSTILYGQKLRELPEYAEACLNDKSFTKELNSISKTYNSYIKELDQGISSLEKDIAAYKKAENNCTKNEENINNLKEKLPSCLIETLNDQKVDYITPSYLRNIEQIQIVAKERSRKYYTLKKLIKSETSQYEKLKADFNENKTEILRLLKSTYSISLQNILKDNLPRLANDIKIDILKIKKLKTDLSAFENNDISVIKKLVKKIYPSYYSNYFYKEFRLLIEELPEYIVRQITLNLPDTSITNLISSVGLVERLPELIGLYSEYIKIKMKCSTKEINLREKNSMLNKIDNEDIINLLEKQTTKIPLMVLEYYKNKSQQYKIIVDYCIKYIDYIKFYIDITIQYNKNKEDIKININKKIKLQSKINDEYYETIFQKIDKANTMLPPSLYKIINNSITKRSLDQYRISLSRFILIIELYKELIRINKKIEKLRVDLEDSPNSNNLESKLSDAKTSLVKHSCNEFNKKLYQKISTSKAEFIQVITEYFENWKDEILYGLYNNLTDYLGIIVTTNLSTRYNVPNMPAIFDYVIIDEASQNDIPSVLPLLFRAKRAVIIGDPNQLRHISSLKEKEVEKISNEHKIGEDLINFHYTKNSAYDLAQKRFVNLTKKVPYTLNYHYRCHKDIIGFSNTNFYDSNLFPKSYIKSDISPLKAGIYWKNIKGKYQDKSNHKEASKIIEFIKWLQSEGLNKKIEIGIITPFRNQKTLISNLLYKSKIIAGKNTDNIIASTVHSFQGDEKDIILYSAVMSFGIANNTLNWLDDSTDLLNVAITRAKSALIIFGDIEFCSKTNGLHKRLLNYCIDVEKQHTKPMFESPTEEKLYRELIKSGTPFEYQVKIGRYRLDFVLQSYNKNLCIELDGGQHQQNKSYDYSRDKYLEGIGYEVLRLPNEYIEKCCSEFIVSLQHICPH